MADTWKLITDKMTELQGFHDRMDKSKDLVYLTPYELKNFEGQKVNKALHITGNKPAVFAHAMVTDLIKAEWQTVIEGEISARSTHEVEQFIEDNLKQADEYLLERYGIVGLHEWLSNHVCIRGPIGAMWYSWVENGNYKIHCLPCDMRWTAYQYGKEGLDWVAPITYRSKTDLEAEFPEVVGKISKTQENEVRDYWNGKVNELWIEKQKITEREHNVGKPPFVLVFPPSGFMLRDKGYMEHEAEDIFYLIRGLNDEVNRTLSIEQSLIFNVLNPGYEREQEAFDAGPSQPVSKTGEVRNVPKGERAQVVPTGDINRANLTARQDIYKMVEEGAPIAPRYYTQPPSGAELIAEMEAIQRLQNSRLIALQMFREQLARLMIEQYVKISQGQSLAIGKRGRRHSYASVHLKDPEKYSISCRLMTKNKRQEIANLGMFAAAYGRLPLKYNLENILMADDPDGIIRELELEQAKQADPAIALFEMALRYAQEGNTLEDEREADAKKIQSQMLTERCEAIILQRVQPAQLPSQAKVPEVQQPKGNANAFLPLMGGMMGQGEAAISRAKEEVS